MAVPPSAGSAFVRDRPPGGIYRRRVVVERSDGQVRAEMEDDNHHFAATMRHDGLRVLDVVGEAVRTPWTTCPETIALLHRLDGIDLATPLHGALGTADPTTSCTHLVDLALLCLAHVGSGPDRVRYDVAVGEPVDGPHEADLWLDGKALVHWKLEADRIVGPDPFSGVDLRRRGFAAWATDTLADELLEPVTVLRRACQISLGRQRLLDRYATAADMPPRVTCHAQSPANARRSLRVTGSSRDFTDCPERLFGG
jgi:hypothetical protein